MAEGAEGEEEIQFLRTVSPVLLVGGSPVWMLELVLQLQFLCFWLRSLAAASAANPVSVYSGLFL